jgi:hypothetical protein
MKDLTRVRNIKDNQQLRASFNELAMNVFGISFEGWYEKGFWTEKYDPFCFVDNSTVIANVSVNILELIMNGEKRRALQIGTVILKNVLSQLGTPTTEKVVFHYTPDYNDLEIESKIYRGSEQLFVKLQASIQMPGKFKHPLTSQA